MLRKKRETLSLFAQLTKSWWILVVLFVTFGLYFEGMRRKGAVETKMYREYARLSHEIAGKEREKQQLEMELCSLNDPEWVELVLKRKLGVVPEGQTKVYFK